MEQVKIIIALIIAIALQWTLRNVAEPLTFIDFPLIIVVYAALQRNAFNALIFGALSGIAVDALSGGLLGANGFSKTLVAYVVSELARRVYLDNLLLQIPVIAGACLLDDLVYYGLHRVLGQEPTAPVTVTIVNTLIGTTIAGTFVYLLMRGLSTDKIRRQKRELFAPRRQTRRRNPIRLGRR
ncbi:MAG: rod shape-determining protein MreD [Acidobacteria bacterium]|nr:rod shape-determining protein MreD [Acidobacteriota bacterium]MBK8147494.1 rod shape-determining protein MreD [Acidobacteriota bacterium]MBK8813968.1 rod shape-determining protein MreD [Acidobacteriota bacterium]